MSEATLVTPRRALVHDELGPAFAEMGSPYAAEILAPGDLAAAARMAAPSSIVLVRPFAGASLAPEPWVRDLVASAGLVPVVALVPFQAPFTPGVRTLLEWGVSEIADAELEASPSAIRWRLLDTHARPFLARVERHLPPSISERRLALIRAASAVVVDGGGIQKFAKSIGAGEPEIAAGFARAAFPSPPRLLAWMRALLAIALLEEPSRTIRQVARVAGYTSDAPLRRAFGELLGGEADLPPRQRGFTDAMSRFNAELRALRGHAPRERH